MLAELNDVVNTNPPSEEFRSLFTKIQYMNTHALQQISTCEQRQREGN